MESETVEIAALGRPLHPGMLYDLRSDTFIPGLALWDQEAINKDINVELQPNTNFTFTASDTIAEKTSMLGVSASLTASFLAGLVEVGGAGSYLNNAKTSMRQCRVTMQCKQTTEYHHLTMHLLGKVTYPDVLEHGSATHVVTAVLYGAESFLVFDQMSSAEETKQEVHGELHVMVKKIPSIEISGKGEVDLTEEERKKVENISCTFHGDVTLEQNPSNYEQAVRLYQDLPKLLGADGKRAVPVRVWLYPLKNLHEGAGQAEGEVPVEQVRSLEAVMGQLHEAEMRANDCAGRCRAIKAADLADKLDEFLLHRGIYAENLRRNVGRVLPAIRAGEAEVQKLVNILDFHEVSSFTFDAMRNWLDEKESEIGVVESYIRLMEGIPIVSPGPELNGVIFDPRQQTVVIFSFTSLQTEEAYLSNLRECLASNEFREMEDTSEAGNIRFKGESLPWFRDPSISQRMRELVSNMPIMKTLPFCSCYISYIPHDTYKGAALFYYKSGTLCPM